MEGARKHGRVCAPVQLLQSVRVPVASEPANAGDHAGQDFVVLTEIGHDSRRDHMLQTERGDSRRFGHRIVPTQIVLLLFPVPHPLAQRPDERRPALAG